MHLAPLSPVHSALRHNHLLVHSTGVLIVLVAGSHLALQFGAPYIAPMRLVLTEWSVHSFLVLSCKTWTAYGQIHIIEFSGGTIIPQRYWIC